MLSVRLAANTLQAWPDYGGHEHVTATVRRCVCHPRHPQAYQSGIIHSFILFSSRLRAHAHKKLKQYKLVKKKGKKIKRINTMYSATS